MSEFVVAAVVVVVDSRHNFEYPGSNDSIRMLAVQYVAVLVVAAAANSIVAERVVAVFVRPVVVFVAAVVAPIADIALETPKSD